MKRRKLERVIYTDADGSDWEVTRAELFRLLTTANGAAACWLAQFCHEECFGPIDACHLIPKQKIKQAFPFGALIDDDGELQPAVSDYEFRNAQQQFGWDARSQDELVYDERIGAPGCRRHHDLLDGLLLHVARRSLPFRVEAYATETGLSWWLDERYGVQEMAA